MSKFVEANEKIAEGVTEGMQKIEDGVVGGYKKIEDGVVGGFKKIEDKFTEKFLNEDGTLKTGKVGDAVVEGAAQIAECHAFGLQFSDYFIGDAANNLIELSVQNSKSRHTGRHKASETACAFNQQSFASSTCSCYCGGNTGSTTADNDYVILAKFFMFHSSHPFSIYCNAPMICRDKLKPCNKAEAFKNKKRSSPLYYFT